MNAELTAAKAKLDAAEAAREESLLRHIANGVLIDSRTVQIGPFTHVRTGTKTAEGCHLGAYVETKNADFAEGNTVSHLTYIGDATVGKYCNFGCGTVTCNYDGEGKYHTTIGDYAFIGCNTNLVAPVTVGDHAFTAAGSTIGHDVPAGALSIERAKQTEIDNWGENKLQKYIAKKQKLEADKKNK